MPRGVLIAFEGVDHCGKSTQVEWLSTRLASVNVAHEVIRFPERQTPIGRLLDEYLRDPSVTLDIRTVHLLFSANRWACHERIKAALAAGTTVLLDRYAYSGVAYTCAKDESLSLEWAKSADAGNIKPDLVFYLRLSFDDLVQRLITAQDQDRERHDDIWLLERAQKIYDQVFSEEWVIFDGARTRADLHKDIYAHSLARIESHAAPEFETPPSSLW